NIHNCATYICICSVGLPQITPASKASGGTLTQGDIISAIDGVSTDGMTHLDAQNKIKAATNKLTLSMQKSRRPAPVPTATPRMESPMPIIPHQKVCCCHEAELCCPLVENIQSSCREVRGQQSLTQTQSNVKLAATFSVF
ncbi:LIM domain-binding protein 3-like, partial [Nematolebias whitei]|uniref:LIM domain-binding protein 3-like n=1 Tax=Nematolebias whitei TaxID=451745 RepID=UPI0018983FF9